MFLDTLGSIIAFCTQLIVFLVVIGVFVRPSDFSNILMSSSRAQTGSVLSYGLTVFGLVTGYTSFATDYTVYQLSKRPRRNVYLVTWQGIFPTLLLIELLGTAIITSTGIDDGQMFINKDTVKLEWGVSRGRCSPSNRRIGRFCVITLALSIVANTCRNTYSVFLTLMVIGSCGLETFLGSFGWRPLQQLTSQFPFLDIAIWTLFWRNLCFSLDIGLSSTKELV